MQQRTVASAAASPSRLFCAPATAPTSFVCSSSSSNDLRRRAAAARPRRDGFAGGRGGAAVRVLTRGGGTRRERVGRSRARAHSRVFHHHASRALAPALLSHAHTCARAKNNNTPLTTHSAAAAGKARFLVELINPVNEKAVDFMASDPTGAAAIFSSCLGCVFVCACDHGRGSRWWWCQTHNNKKPLQPKRKQSQTPEH